MPQPVVTDAVAVAAEHDVAVAEVPNARPDRRS